MDEAQLRSALLANLILVGDVAAGALSFADFIARYADFYYVFALDGHEADAAGKAALKSTRPLVTSPASFSARWWTR